MHKVHLEVSKGFDFLLCVHMNLHVPICILMSKKQEKFTGDDSVFIVVNKMMELVDCNQR